MQNILSFATKMLSRRAMPTPERNYGGGLYMPYDYHIKSQDAFERAIIIRECVERIMDTTGLAEFVVKEYRNGKYLEVDPAHPLYVLLDRPALKLSGYELRANTMGRMLLEGNSFWYLMGQPGGQPESIQLLQPRYITIHTDSNGQITHYEYTPNTHTSVQIHPDAIVHLKNYHPKSSYWGLSILSAAMIEVSGDYAMAQWNQNFFGPRNAVPTMAVEFQGVMTDQDFERTRRDWYERGGLARETMFFRSGVGVKKTVVHDIGLTPAEMAFLEGRKFNHQAIRNLFGVPEPYGTEASSITAERAYYQRIYERLQRLSQQLTLELCPFFERFPGQFRIEFKDIRPVNEELELRKIETAAKFLGINEIRDRFYDAGEVSWGEGPAMGAGSAYLQFFGGRNDMAQAGAQSFEENRGQGYLPDPDKPQQMPDNPQSRGVIDYDRLKLAQRDLLRAYDGREDMATALLNIDRDIATRLPAKILSAEDRNEILRAFDPLFETAKMTGGMAKQIRKLDPAEQRDVNNAIHQLGRLHKKVDKLDVPDDEWFSIASQEL